MRILGQDYHLLDGRPVTGHLKPQWPSACSSLTVDGETDQKPQIDEFSCPFLLTGNYCLEQCGGSQCQLSEKGQSAVDVRHLCGLVAAAPMPGITWVMVTSASVVL